MNKTIYLDKNDLLEILKICGFWESKSGTIPKFYTRFIEDSIKYVKGIDINYFKNNLPSKNIYTTGTIHQDCKDFIEIFDNKIPLPEAFTIIKLKRDYSGAAHEKRIYKELIAFIENKIGQKDFYYLLENYFSHYTPSDNSLLFSYWFELSKSNQSWVDSNKANKFISRHLQYEPNNTITRNFNLKLLLFVNQFKDNVEEISTYIEKHQGDSVFLKGVPKLTSKIKNLSWNEVDTPLISSKKIVGTISMNSEFFIKEYRMTRGDADKFIQESLAFIYNKFNNLSLTYTSNELIINAQSIDDYKYKEEQALEKINQVKILAPYWIKDKKRDNFLAFFQNYFEKINIHKELSEEISPENHSKTKVKKSKI
jgi:hypothetical protein